MSLRYRLTRWLLSLWISPRTLGIEAGQGDPADQHKQGDEKRDDGIV